MDKIEVIKNFPVPNSVKKLRRFLGCCGSYRKYVKGFGQIPDPLYKLLAKIRNLILLMTVWKQQRLQQRLLSLY